MATHSSTLTGTISWTEETDGLQPIGSQRVRHDLASECTHTLSEVRGLLSMAIAPHLTHQPLPFTVSLLHGNESGQSVILHVTKALTGQGEEFKETGQSQHSIPQDSGSISADWHAGEGKMLLVIAQELVLHQVSGWGGGQLVEKVWYPMNVSWGKRERSKTGDHLGTPKRSGSVGLISCFWYLHPKLPECS